MRLRVATLNVWGLPEPLSVAPLRRLHAIGERLPELDLDVVAFQEVWFGRARRILLDAGRRAGLAHAWCPDASLGGSGLLVLSRLPIRRASLSPFALRGHPEEITQGEYYGGKGYALVHLATQAGPVAFVATHLHARYASQEPHAYRFTRAGQIVQLTAGTRRIDAPLVAAGDFNFTQDSLEHDVLTGLSALRDVAHEAGRPEPTVLRGNPFRAGSRKPDRRIDYVFTRDGDASAVRTHAVRRIFDAPLDGGALAYSNHAGVMAELSIASRPALRRWHPSARSIAMAKDLLAAGRAEAKRRRAEQRAVTSAGIGVAALIALGERSLPHVSRRRFLRSGLQLSAAVALAPSVGCSVLSEVFAPDEIRAYDRMARALEDLQKGLVRHRGVESLAAAG